MNQPIPEPQSFLCGVHFPDTIPVFDCRWEDSIPHPKDPSGSVTMWASERAEYALGLRSYKDGIYNAAIPVSIQGYWDTRDPRSESEAARWLADMLERASEEMAKWEALGEDWENSDNGKGGTVFYKPVAIALSNYGVCLICDEKTKRVKFYD